MTNEKTWLISMTDGNCLYRVAFKFKVGSLPDDAEEYPLEPENKKHILARLPAHCKMNIIEVEEIFDVV